MFRVKKGARIFALKSEVIKTPKDFIPKVMNRNAMYDKHHVLIDPIGELGKYNKQNCTESILGEYSSMGFYGFELPFGSGFKAFIVNSKDVEYL